jgi:hypothetical protein
MRTSAAMRKNAELVPVREGPQFRRNGGVAAGHARLFEARA